MNYEHIWIPVIVVDTAATVSEQQWAEGCRRCGTYRNGATPDPPETTLPCPFPRPTLPELTEEERQREAEILFKCRVCGTADGPGSWDFSGKFCPQCGSRHGAFRA